MCVAKNKHASHCVTCLLPMKLNSGGAIPNPTQTHASSDTLLVSIVLERLAEAVNVGGANTAVSPWGAFIAAAGGEKMGWKTWLRLYTDSCPPHLVCIAGCSELACGVVISSYIPSFLDDRLLFCCRPPEEALLRVSWDVGLPVPGLSIFSISFNIRVPFYNRQITNPVQLS